MKRSAIAILLISIIFLNYGQVFDQGFTNAQVIEKRVQGSLKSADSNQSLNTLKAEIESILDDNKLSKSKFGISIFSLDRGIEIYSRNADTALTPASTTKLFTTYTTLNHFGKDWTINTTLYADGKIEDGVLEGNLVLVGRGDPMLSIPDIENLAGQVSDYGIKQINGDILADPGFFDSKTDRLQYSGDKDRVEPTPPITSINLEKNTVTVLVTSGQTSGKDVSVTLLPPSSAFKTVINAKVASNPAPVKKVRSIKKRRIGYMEENVLDRVGDSKKSKARKIPRLKGGISITHTENSDGLQVFTINGTLAPNRSYSYSYHIKNPAVVAAGALADRLALFNVKVKGKPGIKTRTEDKIKSDLIQVAEFKRKALDIIYPIIKHSDNYLAEILFKSAGAHAALNPDNARSMLKLENDVFNSMGLNTGKCILYDGSGLSRRNRLTANALVKLLTNARKSPFAYQFDSCLSFAGIDGTLRRRMISTRAENNLHAKTGTHGNVSSLCGYVTSLDGEQIAFAMLFNGPNVGYYKQVEDKIGSLLADFFYFNENTASK